MHNPTHISSPNIVLKEPRDEIIHMRHFKKDIRSDYMDLYIGHNRKALETCVGMCKHAAKGWGCFCASFLVYL